MSPNQPHRRKPQPPHQAQQKVHQLQHQANNSKAPPPAGTSTTETLSAPPDRTQQTTDQMDGDFIPGSYEAFALGLSLLDPPDGTTSTRSQFPNKTTFGSVTNTSSCTETDNDILKESYGNNEEDSKKREGTAVTSPTNVSDSSEGRAERVHEETSVVRSTGPCDDAIPGEVLPAPTELQEFTSSVTFVENPPPDALLPVENPPPDRLPANYVVLKSNNQKKVMNNLNHQLLRKLVKKRQLIRGRRAVSDSEKQSLTQELHYTLKIAHDMPHLPPLKYVVCVPPKERNSDGVFPCEGLYFRHAVHSADKKKDDFSCYFCTNLNFGRFLPPYDKDLIQEASKATAAFVLKFPLAEIEGQRFLAKVDFFSGMMRTFSCDRDIMELDFVSMLNESWVRMTRPFEQGLHAPPHVRLSPEDGEGDKDNGQNGEGDKDSEQKGSKELLSRKRRRTEGIQHGLNSTQSLEAKFSVSLSKSANPARNCEETSVVGYEVSDSIPSVGAKSSASFSKNTNSAVDSEETSVFGYKVDDEISFKRPLHPPASKINQRLDPPASVVPPNASFASPMPNGSVQGLHQPNLVDRTGTLSDKQFERLQEITPSTASLDKAHAQNECLRQLEQVTTRRRRLSPPQPQDEGDTASDIDMPPKTANTSRSCKTKAPVHVNGREAALLRFESVFLSLQRNALSSGMTLEGPEEKKYIVGIARRQAASLLGVPNKLLNEIFPLILHATNDFLHDLKEAARNAASFVGDPLNEDLRKRLWLVRRWAVAAAVGMTSQQFDELDNMLDISSKQISDICYVVPGEHMEFYRPHLRSIWREMDSPDVDMEASRHSVQDSVNNTNDTGNDDEQNECRSSHDIPRDVDDRGTDVLNSGVEHDRLAGAFSMPGISELGGGEARPREVEPIPEDLAQRVSDIVVERLTRDFGSMRIPRAELVQATVVDAEIVESDHAELPETMPRVSVESDHAELLETTPFKGRWLQWLRWRRRRKMIRNSIAEFSNNAGTRPSTVY